MKDSLAVLLLSLGGLQAAGQGTLWFSTRVAGQVDARVVHTGGSPLQPLAGPIGSQYVGQLYAAPVRGTFAPLGLPVPFRETPVDARGYILDGGEVEVPGVAPGEAAQVRFVAWHQALGKTYEEAIALGWGGDWGESPVAIIVTGGSGSPPAPLVDLRGFTISWMPEPSPVTLITMGAVVLALGRRRSG